MEEEKAKRFNTNKLEVSDTPLLGMVEVMKVTRYGACKYGTYNWKKEASTSQYLNCAFRHLLKYMYGEDIDSESGCSHLGHAAWNILALIEKILVNKQDDDRFKYDTNKTMDEVFDITKKE